jgi:hypothetical protein
VRDVFETLADPSADRPPPSCELLLDQSPEQIVHGTLSVMARATSLPTVRVDAFDLDGTALYDPERDTRAPAAMHAAAWAIDTTTLATTWHLLTARCSDPAGRSSTARVPFAK